MKVFLFLILMTPLVVPAQDETPSLVEEKYKQDDVPPRGIKAVPQLQQEKPNMENPFQIGPYKDGKYQYANPNRDPDANAAGEG